jgi:outer membrane biosynthesis protein TonB
MPISLILILAGIVVALVINFIPKKKNFSLDEDPITPFPISEPETVPEPTPDEVPYPKVDPPLPTGEAKLKKKPQPKKKPATKVDA